VGAVEAEQAQTASAATVATIRLALRNLISYLAVVVWRERPPG
jgi:hypothetical protein